MSLSAKSNICVSSGSVSVDWLLCSLWVLFCCFLAYLVIFDWMPHIVNLIFWGTGYSCISINALFLFCDVVKLPGNSLILWGSWFSDLLSRTGAYYQGNSLLYTLPNAQWIMRLSSQSHMAKHYSWPSLMHCSLELKEDSLQISRFLFLCTPLVSILHAANSSLLVLSRLSALFIQLMESAGLCLSSLFLLCSRNALSRGKLGKRWYPPYLLPISALGCSILKNIGSCILSVFCLFQMGGQIYSLSSY